MFDEIRRDRVVGAREPDGASRPAGYLRRGEAAEYAGLSLSTIDRAIASGELDSRKRGRARLTRAAWIDAWLNAALTVAVVFVYVCALLVAFALAGRPICRHLFPANYCPFA